MNDSPWMDVLAYIVDHPVAFAGFAAITYAMFAKGLRAATWVSTIFTVSVMVMSSIGGAQFVGGVVTGVVANEITQAIRRRSGRS